MSYPPPPRSAEVSGCCRSTLTPTGSGRRAWRSWSSSWPSNWRGSGSCSWSWSSSGTRSRRPARPGSSWEAPRTTRTFRGEQHGGPEGRGWISLEQVQRIACSLDCTLFTLFSWARWPSRRPTVFSGSTRRCCCSTATSPTCTTCWRSWWSPPATRGSTAWTGWRGSGPSTTPCRHHRTCCGPTWVRAPRVAPRVVPWLVLVRDRLGRDWLGWEWLEGIFLRVSGLEFVLCLHFISGWYHSAVVSSSFIVFYQLLNLSVCACGVGVGSLHTMENGKWGKFVPLEVQVSWVPICSSSSSPRSTMPYFNISLHCKGVFFSGKHVAQTVHFSFERHLF